LTVVTTLAVVCGHAQYPKWGSSKNLMPRVKMYLPLSRLGIYVKRQIPRYLRKKGIYPSIYLWVYLAFYQQGYYPFWQIPGKVFTGYLP